MEFVAVLFGISYSTILGYIVARFFLPELSLRDILGISFGVGVGVIYSLMFVYSLLGLNWTFFNLIIPGLILFAFFGLKMSKVKVSFTKPSLKAFPLILLSSYVIFESISRPLLSWDGWATWLFRSKIFYFDGNINPLSIIYSGSDYPLAISLFVTFLYEIMSSANDKYALLMYPAFYISLLISFYSLLRKSLSVRMSIVFTFLLGATQNIIRHAGYFETGMSDFPLAYFIFISFFLYLIFSKSQSLLNLLLLQFVLGITALIKNEGITFAIILEALIILKLVRTKNYRAFLSIPVFLITWLSWELFKSLNDISLNYIIMNRTFNSNDFFIIIFRFLLEMINIKNWNLLWIVFAIGILIFLKNFKKFPNKVVYLLIFGQLLAYYMIFLITPVDVGEHLSILDRLYIHLIPLVVFAIAMSFGIGKGSKR